MRPSSLMQSAQRWGKLRHRLSMTLWSIASHSSLQNCNSSSNPNGPRRATRYFKIAQSCSIGFKSGDTAGHSGSRQRTIGRLVARYFFEPLCAGALSCIRTALEVAWRWRIGIRPIKASKTFKIDEKQAKIWQSIMLPHKAYHCSTIST